MFWTFYFELLFCSQNPLNQTVGFLNSKNLTNPVSVFTALAEKTLHQRCDKKLFAYNNANDYQQQSNAVHRI